jgi:hypothetical protein
MDSKILDKIPTQSYEEAEQLGKELLSGGAEQIGELVALVGDEFGDSKGVKPKFAVHAAAIYAARPGADGDRKMVAEALAKQLDAEHSDELKAFVCRQLQLCGREEEIGALANLLGNDRLCEPATQALLAIGGKAAQSALQSALGGATGKRQATLRQAVETINRK